MSNRRKLPAQPGRPVLNPRRRAREAEDITRTLAEASQSGDDDTSGRIVGEVITDQELAAAVIITLADALGKAAARLAENDAGPE